MSVGCSRPATSYPCSEKSCTSASSVIAWKSHFSVARVLYSGSAILRGSPAWAQYVQGGNCADLGGQPPSGRIWVGSRTHAPIGTRSLYSVEDLKRRPGSCDQVRAPLLHYKLSLSICPSAYMNNANSWPECSASITADHVANIRTHSLYNVTYSSLAHVHPMAF